MSFSQGYNQLFYKEITSSVSEESLLEYYLGITHIPCLINSPLRVDKKPSFGLYYYNNNIYYKDFAKKSDYGSVINLLMKVLKINNFGELIDIISKDLPNIQKLDKYIVRSNKNCSYNRDVNKKSTLSNIEVKVREWKNYDLEFWKSFGISKYWLDFGKVYPISHIKIANKTFTSEKFAYCYVEFKDNKPTLKVYQPFSDNLKWLNNHGSSVWDLWTQAINYNHSDKLIITSSRKDALCLWANTHIPSVSLQAEGYLPKPHVVKILQDKFPIIYCLYDNDFDKEENYGREYGLRLCNLYNFKQIEIPKIYESKDPSDLYKNKGEEIFKKVINNLLNNEV